MYTLRNLYVVEVKYDYDVRYLICKKSFAGYVNIFTNNTVDDSDCISVEPLSNYYSILKRYSFCSYYISKRLLFDKLLSINKEASLEKGKKLSSGDNFDINKILEEATVNFFPKKGEWSGHCFKRSSDLIMINLPCHVRDDLWLAKMLKKDQKLLYISSSDILQFVKNSTFFNEKRFEYERLIIKWQIYWMTYGGENWIVDDSYGGQLIYLSPQYDLGFRKGIVDTLTKIGINIDAIEEGIEKNAYIWRDHAMNMAFANEYAFDSDFEENDQESLRDFKEKWLKMRKYEYYQRHKDSVDKYGIVEPDMLLSDDEATQLMAQLEQKHKEIESIIKKYMEKGKTKKFFRLRQDF